MGILRIIAGVFGAFMRLWDWFTNPKRVRRKQIEAADRAIAENDCKKVNEILDKAGRG